MTKQRHFNYTRQIPGGICVNAEVSPCVFMYEGYPLQLTITLSKDSQGDLGTAYAVDRGKAARNFTEADVKRLADQVEIKQCDRCPSLAFDPASIETNRSGLCEACFLAELETEWRAAEAEGHARIAANDRNMKDTGMAFRVTAWVHPLDGGDDYQVDWYFPSRPAKSQIQRLLRKKGSDVTHDFQILAL